MSALESLSPYDWARISLLSYSSLMMPAFHIGKMQLAIAQALDCLESGQLTRLLIEAPPQHGKSTLASIFFPSWYLGRHPEQSLIYATYGQERANDIGTAVRNTVRSEEHYATFGQKLSEESSAKDRFSLYLGKQRADYFAVGRGSAITGRGAHGIIIDDPIKDQVEAASKTVRKELQDWYNMVLYTRLQKAGWVMLIQTRWDVDDMAGWLMAEHAQDGWTRLRMPAIAEEDDSLGRAQGEALSPERYDVDALARIRSIEPPRVWDALYQQQPTQLAGDIYLREWFEPRYETIRDRVRYYGFSDYAVTEGGGDSTEHGIFAVDPDWNAYAVDWYSGKVKTDVWVEKMIDMAAQWHVACWYEEGGVIAKAIRPLIVRRQRERHQFFRLESMSSITDKVTRSTSAVGRAAHKRILFPFTTWANEVIEQLIAFHDGSTQDDKVDVVSLLGRALDKMAAPAHAQGVKVEPKPFTVKWLMQEKSDGKPRRF